MAQPTINIDDVVREVLAQLGLAPHGPTADDGKAAANGAPAPEKTPPEPAAPASQPAPGDGQLVLQCRVVTLAELGERLSGVRQLVVPPQAIVTPAVRDELYRRNIALSYRSSSSKPDAGRARLVLMAVGSTDFGAAAALLQNEGIAVERHQSDCLIEAADRLASDLGDGRTLAVLATTHPAAALCLANRLAGVRAVLGSDPRTVAAETASVGANLLVVNPVGMGLFQLKQLVRRFYEEPQHECPEVFRKRLG